MQRKYREMQINTHKIQCRENEDKIQRNAEEMNIPMQRKMQRKCIDKCKYIENTEKFREMHGNTEKYKENVDSCRENAEKCK